MRFSVDVECEIIVFVLSKIPHDKQLVLENIFIIIQNDTYSFVHVFLIINSCQHSDDYKFYTSYSHIPPNNAFFLSKCTYEQHVSGCDFVFKLINEILKNGLQRFSFYLALS